MPNAPHTLGTACCKDGHFTLPTSRGKGHGPAPSTTPSRSFVFDAVFNESDSNAAIYQAALRPLLQHVFAGGAATVFAFGQTGSGKTCTMAGHGDESAADGNAVGLYALAAADVVSAAHADGATVAASFFEVYRGQVRPRAGRSRAERWALAREQGSGEKEPGNVQKSLAEGPSSLSPFLRRCSTCSTHGPKWMCLRTARDASRWGWQRAPAPHAGAMRGTGWGAGIGGACEGDGASGGRGQRGGWPVGWGPRSCVASTALVRPTAPLPFLAPHSAAPGGRSHREARRIGRGDAPPGEGGGGGACDGCH